MTRLRVVPSRRGAALRIRGEPSSPSGVPGYTFRTGPPTATLTQDRALQSPYDFATGNTNPEAFPTDALVEAARAAIPEVARYLNIYPGKLGHPGLRALMAAREKDREGVDVDPEHLVLTNGSMQAVTLVAEALCHEPGGRVVMEDFNYPGTINAYRSLGIDMLGVPLDGYGMRMDVLADTMKRMHDEGRPPRFIYTLATYQNPTGAMMPTSRRLELLDIVHEYDAILVEDNCYGDVHFDGDKPPAFYTLDNSSNQIYLCSLSKIFAPGIRLGYLYARPPMLDRLLQRRHDAGPNTLQSPGHGPLGPAGQVHLLQTASARFDPVITGRTELRKPAAM